jgi:hypothetical protein
MRGLLPLFCLFILWYPMEAQWRNDSGTTAGELLPPHVLRFSPSGDSLGENRKYKSPGLAVLLSAVVPGAGQWYTERYLKIPIIWGFGGYFVSQWMKADRRYRNFRNQYAESVRMGVRGGRGDDQLRYVRDFYHDERDRFGFYIALTYLLNIVDAYVGASLYNFDVSDELGEGVSMRVKIPLN